ncbi:MAG: hypothetical protein K1X89_08080 [Myxococcaceae bacterium]|nr:hypothetical protein [Myxococcaceae bacterium]
MLAFALGVQLLALGATRPVDVVVSRAVDVSPQEQTAIAERLVLALRAQGMTAAMPGDVATRLKALGASRPESCAAERSCVARLGALLQSYFVVSVDLGRVAGQLAVAVEAISPADAKVVGHRAGTAGTSDAVAPLLESFAAQLRPKVPDVPEPEVSPTPKLVPVAAPETPAVPAQAVEVAAAPSHLPAKVTLGIAGALAAGSLASLTAGLVFKSRFDASRSQVGGLEASRLPQADAQALAGSANAAFSVALVGALLSAATLGVSGFLWLGPGES